MASQPQPVTPVRVPKAATAYAPTTQDPDLRSQINTLLLREGHVEKIEQALHHALHAHPSNWPTRVSLHALSLLRSGDCTTFPTLMERVLADIRRDTDAARLCPPRPASPLDPIGPAKKAAGAVSGSSPELQRRPLAAGVAIDGVAVNTLGKEKAAVGGGGAGPGLVNGAVLNGVGGGDGSTGLAVPQIVVDEGIRITRECLEQVCEVDE